MPDARFYSHIFRHVIYLLENGEPSSVPGAPSPSIAHFYVDRAGATADENSILIANAKAWKAEVDPIDLQAHNIVAAIHAQTPGGKLAPGQGLPAVPQVLRDLQAQRDAVTLKHMEALRQKFGEMRFSALNASLHRVTRVSFQGPAPIQRPN
jgi:hypothetical protein